MTGVLELILDQTEADVLGGAIGNVLNQYEISILDDKTTSWINLAQIAFGIYGTRIIANRTRKATERRRAMDAAREARDNPPREAPPTAPRPPSSVNTTVVDPAAHGLPAVILDINQPGVPRQHN
jgi:hypothetical protein